MPNFGLISLQRLEYMLGREILFQFTINFFSASFQEKMRKINLYEHRDSHWSKFEPIRIDHFESFYGSIFCAEFKYILFVVCFLSRNALFRHLKSAKFSKNGKNWFILLKSLQRLKYMVSREILFPFAIIFSSASF